VSLEKYNNFFRFPETRRFLFKVGIT